MLIVLIVQNFPCDYGGPLTCAWETVIVPGVCCGIAVFRLPAPWAGIVDMQPGQTERALCLHGPHTCFTVVHLPS